MFINVCNFFSDLLSLAFMDVIILINIDLRQVEGKKSKNYNTHNSDCHGYKQ